MRFRVFSFAVMVALLLLLAVPVAAGVQSVQIVNAPGYQLTFTTPDTYSNCGVQRTDTISITGVPPGVYVVGYVRVEYVTDNGRILVPGGEYSILQMGDLNLDINYPAIQSWPVINGDTREIHVDMSIGLYTATGIKVQPLQIVSGPGTGNQIPSFGPYNDWDVFCVGNPPPPPPPPPGGDEGCTPGYWKNHLDSWVGYGPYQVVGTVFSASNPYGLDTLTLLDALKFKGGPGEDGGARILLRAAVAALLNASNSGVEYPRTTAEIIADVNAALASGNRNTMLALKDGLDADNNLGCPLN